MAIVFYVQKEGEALITCLSSDAKPGPPAPPDNWLLFELDSPRRFRSTGGAWVEMATTWAYSDLTGLPTLGTAASTAASLYALV